MFQGFVEQELFQFAHLRIIMWGFAHFNLGEETDFFP